jgi:O-acetylhomoserine/O-acetylserine sulfhydrylase-like pyridoxal-dependent enzyme
MSTSQEEWGEGTKTLHAGYSPVPMDMMDFRSFVPPLIQSAVYPLKDVDHYTRISKGLEPGYTYGRTMNPTVDILQERLAALEGGESALATASGMHAVFALTSHLAKVGDEIVTSHMTYGEAYKLFFQLAPERMGIKPRFVKEPGNLDEWERQITPKTRFVWAETPSNPTLFVTDIAGLAKITRAHHVPLIVDSTLATPCLLRPLELGADIVLHSLTKFICGNGTIVGGAVIGKEGLITDLRKNTLAYIGATMSPFDAWLTLMSLETLPSRIARHCSNAEQVADFLVHHPRVRRVNYPSISDHPQHALAKRQMPKGFGGMLSFVVDGGREGAVKVIETCQMIAIVPSFGTSRTIATHPATHTHDGMTPQEREAAGIYDGLIRLSVGLEDAKDIIADLEQALGKL